MKRTLKISLVVAMSAVLIESLSLFGCKTVDTAETTVEESESLTIGYIMGAPEGSQQTESDDAPFACTNSTY